MIRQLVAIALGASMLNVNVQRADVVCASHHESERHAPPAHAMHEHDAAATTAHPAGAESAGEGGCQTPLQPDCCSALTACGPLMVLADARATASPRPVRDAITQATQTLPLSRIAGPEPPPPRA